MNNYYVILAVSEDFGTMDDGKPWKGVRFCCQEYRVKNGKAISASTCVIKAGNDVGYKIGVKVNIFFDRNGKAAKVDEIK